MNQGQDPTEPVTNPIRWRPAVIAGFVGVVVAVGAAMGYRTQPKLPGFEEYDFVTSAAGSIVQMVTWGGAFVTLAGLAAILVLRPHAAAGTTSLAPAGVHHGVRSDATPWLRITRRGVIAWLAASVIGIPVVSAAALNMPVAYAVFGFDTFIASSQVAQLWLFQTILVAMVGALVLHARTIGGLALAGYIGVLALLPNIVIGPVSVGADHDLATDAAILGTLALALVAPTALAVTLLGGGTQAPRRLRRYQWVSGPGAVLMLITGLVITWQGLAGTPPFASAYGVIRVLTAAACVALIVTWLVRLRCPVEVARTLVGVDLSLYATIVGAWVAGTVLVPPRYAVPQTEQINYLGYSVDTPPTVWMLLGPARPNLLIVTLAVVALVGYAVAHARLARRQIQWPISRTVCWTLGWIVILMVSATGLWKYSGAAFSIHMGVHMAVNMLAPVLIVLGAPITMALRALPAHRGTDLPSPRDILQAVLAWKPLELLLHPIAVWLYFVSGFYGLYFSSLFDTAMRYHWAHQLMTVHFLVTGLLFYGLVIGADRPPRPLPYVGKIGFLFSAMPFHAFFAVGIMNSPALLAPTFYPTLDVAWVDDLLADQTLGGEITWATGEIPMIMVIIALVFQWVRQDSRDAKRRDRAMDSGLDDSFEAYNAMLARLDEQNRRPDRTDAHPDDSRIERARIERTGVERTGVERTGVERTGVERGRGG